MILSKRIELGLVRVARGGFVVDTSKPVIVLAHGTQSWRNQILLAALSLRLSDELHCHTLRFDFTGHGHSNGEWKYPNLGGEAKDLQEVVHFVREEMKCKVLCVFGHSKGNHAVLQLALQEEQRLSQDRIEYFCLAAARFRRAGVAVETLSAAQEQELNREGKVRLCHPTTGQDFELTRQDWIECRDFDSSFCAKAHRGKFLVVHGAKDKAVPCQDANLYKKVLPHNKTVILAGADHNFNGLKYLGTMVQLVSELVKS